MVSTKASMIEATKDSHDNIETLDRSTTMTDIHATRTIEIDNYHGFTLQCCLVYIAIVMLGFAQMMVIVSSGLLSRSIGADLGGSALTIWLPQSVVIVNLALAPPVSQAADFWGRKGFLMFSLIPAVVGGIVTSRATSMPMAMVGNLLASVSTASQPLLFAIASEIVPRKYRPEAQAGINATFGLGGIVTLLVGSACTRDYRQGWRIVWYIITGLFALAGLLTFLFYNPPPRDLQVSLSSKEKIRRVDWVGIIALPVAVSLFVVGLSWSDNPFSWTDAHVLAPFLIGCAGLIALIVYEVRIKTGIFHHELFNHDRNFALALFLIFVEGVAFFATNNFFPFEITVLFERDPVMVGLRFSIVFIASIVAGFAVSFYSSRKRQLRLPLLASFLCFVIFYACMASVKLGSSKVLWLYPVFLGFGLGGCLTLIVVAAQFSAAPALISLSSGLLIAARSFGATIGLPIFNAIFNSQITKKLPAKVASAVLPLGLSPRYLPDFIHAANDGNVTAVAAIPGVTPQIIQAGFHGLQEAYLESFRIIHITAAVISVVAVIACFFIIDPKADFTMHVDAPVEKETPVEKHPYA